MTEFNDALVRTYGPTVLRCGTLGSRCRSGCKTRDHASYAECCKGLQLSTGEALTLKEKGKDSELKAYRSARAEGIQPLGTKMAQVEQAKRMSDASGVAFGV